MGHSLPQFNPDVHPAERPARPAEAPPEARSSAAGGRLIDAHGRIIRDLRLSVTDRCNFRCTYCMDPGVRFLPRRSLLKADELVRLAGICFGLGIDKIRLTGGEPLVYPELDDVIRGIARAARDGRNSGCVDVALTTNGSLLDPPRIDRLRRAGLTRLTISIDSVSDSRFAAITRSTATPEMVLGAVHAAVRGGLSPVKVNAVVVRGMNDDELPALASIARDLGIEMRFIEFMPLDASRTWDPRYLVPASEIVSRISERYALAPIGRDEPSSTATMFRFADGAPGRIGIIAPVTQPFCNQCSRLRITADGKVRPCLFSTQEWDLRPLLSGGASDGEIASFIVAATWVKQRSHGISTDGFVRPARSMGAIGG